MIIQVPIRHHGREHEPIILVFVLIIVHNEVKLSQGIIAFSLGLSEIMIVFKYVMIKLNYYDYNTPLTVF